MALTRSYKPQFERMTEMPIHYVKRRFKTPALRNLRETNLRERRIERYGGKEESSIKFSGRKDHRIMYLRNPLSNPQK